MYDHQAIRIAVNSTDAHPLARPQEIPHGYLNSGPLQQLKTAQA